MSGLRLRVIAAWLAGLLLLLAAIGCSSGASPRPTASPVASIGISSATPTSSAAPGSPSVASSAPSCSSHDPIACLAAGIDLAGHDGRFAGVVLVSHDGVEIWHGAYGGPASGGTYDLDSAFEIHSVTKMFTAIAVAQLVAAGKLDYDDQLHRYLDDMPADRADVTIAELLTHTAGLDGPRGTFAYSNAGFILLGLVIERVAGSTYQSYVEARVFDPAGMTSTGVVGDPVLGSPSSAYGQRSTANDLLRYSNALTSETLIDAAAFDLLTTEKVQTTDTEAYGYGFMIVGSAAQPRTVGHFGAEGDVIKSGVIMNPALGETIVVLDDRGFVDIEPAIRTYATRVGMPYWPA